MDEKLQETLASILHWSPSPNLALDLPENQRRNVDEVQRRRRCGVAVGEAPTPNRLVHPKKAMEAHAPKKISAEVEALKNDNIRLKASLEEAEGRRRAAEFAHLLEVEGVSRTLKRTSEELEASARARNEKRLKPDSSSGEAKELSIHHAQAHAKIKELEKAREEDAQNASSCVSAEVETLKNVNLQLKASLEEAERCRQAADFANLLEVEDVSQTLKRRYGEELEASAPHPQEKLSSFRFATLKSACNGMKQHVA
ncbi:hypothetical protein C8R44DRAFT_879949 [Mycena epipterygia]|nr:hypothetical protein C8R44DRAFT_879949 [Mycena epipterygia]